MLPAHRLRATRDYQRLRSEGRSWGHRLLSLQTLGRDDDLTRCGFVVSKRVGKAVIRNRVKRRMREATRALLPRLSSGWDLAFSARPTAATAPWSDVRGAVEEVARRAGLLRD